ncbi:hypothetical protein GGR52DRAFT_573251 [Hypoxylon sp. FL1284]|nr:hypothetical protein GGR52DRAFT_573251 [Hypoxylon sp. FL1284]
MAKRPTPKVPDAWEDDDWEVQADKAAAEEPAAQPSQPPQMSKAERLAQHAESNRKIWDEAPPETFHYLAARADPPLATTFKPAVKVLSRKPVRPADDEDEDDDESKKSAPRPTPEETVARQQRERDERQRRYDEARAKIFGSPAPNPSPSSGASTPGAVTPPPRSADGRGHQRGRGGRGGGRGGGGQHRRNESRGDRDSSNNGFGQRPNSQSGGRELYDPKYAPKPTSQPFERRPNSGASTPRDEDQQQQTIRSPRGPDGSGRGGFGFAKRGAKGS